jgi:hypothetical protein
MEKKMSKTKGSIEIIDDINDNIYAENGYADRKDYLKSLSETMEIPYYIVRTCAAILGESEDFDGLVSMLEDCGDMV